MKKTIISLILLLSVIAVCIIVIDIDKPKGEELNYTGNVTEVEFLGGRFSGQSQTLVRFIGGDTLVFNHHKKGIPLHKEVVFYYIKDIDDKQLILNRFEIGGEKDD